MTRSRTPRPVKERVAGPLESIAFLIVLFVGAAGLFFVLHQIGVPNTVSMIIGPPAFVAILIGVGNLRQRRRLSHPQPAPPQHDSDEVRAEIERETWSVPGLGTTWIERGRAYWVRRAGLWIGFAALVALTTVMTIGVAIGMADGLTDPWIVAAVAIVGNLSAFAYFLDVTWPTRSRIEKRANHPKTSPRTTGAGSSLGMMAIGSPAIAVIIIPVCLCFMAGVSLAALVLVSLPHHPAELALAAQRDRELAHRKHKKKPTG